MKKLNDMIEGREKEAVLTSNVSSDSSSQSPSAISPNPVSPRSTGAGRWSGATATENGFGKAGEIEFQGEGKGGRMVPLGGKMVEFKQRGEDGGKTPISATATESPGEEFRTWESWAQR